MGTLTLRGLAKTYSDGIVDRRKYIRERRQLIDNIVSGQVAITPYEATAPAIHDHERTFSDAENTAKLPPIETDPPQPNKSNFIIVVVAILALAGIALVGWIKLTPRPDALAPAQVEPHVTVSKADQPISSEELLSKFLDENRWQAERVDELIQDWRRLQSESSQALIDSPAMHRAIDVIYQKFLEENALLELGDRDDVLAVQRQLLDLATELSPGNARIARLEEEWRAGNAETVALSPEDSQSISERSIAAVDLVSEPNAAPLTPPDELRPTTELPDEHAIQSATETQVSNEARPDPDPSANIAQIAAIAAEAEDVGKPVPDQPERTTRRTSNTGNEAPVAIKPGTDEPSTSSNPPLRKSGCRAALAQQRRPFCRDALTDKLRGPALVVLPAGKIEVGGRNAEEQPRRLVTIARPFALGTYEISAREFETFCSATKTSCPAQPWSDPNLPIVNVPWTLATKYTQWLSEITGATYRLPSEAEWEYAARAGTTTPYPFGDEVLPTDARFSFRGTETMPLPQNDRSVNRNDFRLYHMIGNVREWVIDVWHENHAGAPTDASPRNGNSDQHVVRGGSYSDNADNIRSASRLRLSAQTGDAHTGFRILREVD